MIHSCGETLQSNTGGFYCPKCDISFTATMRMVSDGPSLQNFPVIDIERAAFLQIKKAADESPWIPKEYMLNDIVADIVRFLKTDHDHACGCGTSQSDHGHIIGHLGCVRSMVDAPTLMSDGQWLVGGFLITDYTLRYQRGYHQHPCGCWSSHGESENSIKG